LARQPEEAGGDNPQGDLGVRMRECILQRFLIDQERSAGTHAQVDAPARLICKVDFAKLFDTAF
jgi:hypothetical protein